MSALQQSMIFLLLTNGLLCKEVIYDYEYRLSTHLTPIVYDLKLTFSSFSEDINGQVQLQFQVENVTNFIELHADPAFISVKQVSLENKLFDEVRDLEIPKINAVTQTIRFDIAGMIEKHHVYYLNVWYNTKYSFDHRGLIRKQDSVPERNLNFRGLWLNSLFETTYARRLLPCMDEPNFRSSFKLHLDLYGEYAKPDVIALSCMEGERAVQNENSSSWSFVSTPPIPTYLFNIAVGRFRSFCKTSALIDSEICIWRFAHWTNWESTAEKIIETIANFQNEMSAYLLADPVARLHFLIAPSKLKGMENFGLLNIKESLWPIENDSNSYQEFTRTLFHEMTHLYFGNLVTVNWWSDIWLSESLVTYLSSVKPTEPEHDRSIEPIVSKKWSMSIPSIVYSKGSAVVQMLEWIIGPKQIQRLLRAYLRRHQFGHVSTNNFLHLLDTLTTESSSSSESKNETVTVVRPSAFMRSWLTQGSYPIVTVTYDKSVHQFVLSQKPKLYSRSLRSRRAQWPIPIWIDCVAGTVKEKLYWLLPGHQIVLSLSQLTETQDYNAVAFNRNYENVYYEISYRY
ncbi:Peptidase M1, membrane alanine aminopeptidase,N-terminal domain-containing protein [Aphelenchoides besseyi]|nr:Peptidase M1, membrane alanine aminopeptidase,N-terminal domain-containing protein [Aphelenchoides besseyi]